MFRQCGNIRAACEAAGIDRQTYYNWRAADPEFAAACEQADDDALDRLEETGRQRALESSDTLLIFFLKAGRPEKYRDRFTVDLVSKFERMNADELDRYLAERLAKAFPGGEDRPGLPAGIGDDDGAEPDALPD